MLKNIVSLALVAAAVVGGAAGQELQLAPRANSKDVVVAIAKPAGSGIKAEVRFIQVLSGSGLQVDVQVQGLTKGEKYPYHIHQKPVPANGNCTATGGHLDPAGAAAAATAAGGKYKCDPANPASCELGDLAGLYGNMTADANGAFVASYNATQLAFGGKNTILDHSVVIHGPNGTRLACANIIGYILSTDQDSAAGLNDGESGTSNTHSPAAPRAVVASAGMLLLAAAATLF
ncbi:Superoxide dismutase [Coemansia javaensis]|uniref:Superoxide dismutase n=1 Tax=Coemansia javaensis TaxID=2761396 RepID=A0A9W8HJ08_9FUNG|nr:Superoxide dismutase [Coemansia javaensis]